MVTKNILNLKIFKAEYPNCYTEYLKIHGDTYHSFNSAIDSLLFSFGIGIVLIPVYSAKSDQLMGYKSIIKYYPDNKLKVKSADTVYIEDYKKFKTPEKANIATTIQALNVLEDALAFIIQ